MPQPNDRVKKHLKKNGVEPSELPDSVIATLNTCSQDELDAMDRVGASLEDANVPPNKAITAVH
jgi:hypothetical protein